MPWLILAMILAVLKIAHLAAKIRRRYRNHDAHRDQEMT